MVKIDKISAGGIGLVTGICISTGFMIYNTPNTSRVEVFQRENKPAVMRIYKTGSDGLYVESVKDKFITSNQYLKQIPNEADRKIEEAKIKKIVGWYDE